MNSDRYGARMITIGSSDAFNHGGRANSSFWVEDSLGSYLLDCGPTTTMSLQKLSSSQQLELRSLDVIYLTHLHGDHIGGLPVLLLELCFGQGRKHPLLIAGPVGAESRVRALCECSYSGMIESMLPFDLIFKEWPLRGEGVYGQRTVKSVPAQHDPQSSPTSIRISDDHHSIAFSGDTGWSDELRELSSGVDAFVIECSYKDAVFAGHLSLEEIESQREQLTPKKLILTHFSDDSREAAQESSKRLDLHVADDGVQWKL